VSARRHGNFAVSVTGILGFVTVVAALLLLLLLHELGHFVFALLCRVRVSELTLGFGPVLGSFSVRGMQVDVRWLPITAAVCYEGDAGADAYSEGPAWKRALIDVGGPVASYVAASVLIFVLAVSGWLMPSERREPQPQSLATAVELAVLVPVELTRDQVRGLEALVLGAETQRVEGPVAVGRELVVAARRGPWSFASAMAMLSIAIGFFNLLPIPGLDGGKLLFNLIEVVRRRRLQPRIAAKIQAVSLCGLLLLVAVLSAVELKFPVLALVSWFGIPLLIGAGIGVLHPVWCTFSWRVVIGLGAGLGVVVALFTAFLGGVGAGLLAGVLGTLLASCVVAIAAGGYCLAAAWVRRSSPLA
jgi:regulator of sigma E protease